MPRGDWHPDTRALHGIVNVQLTTDGDIHHVGVSYTMVSPNGTSLKDTAFSWPVPANHRTALKEIMQALSEAVINHEGISGMDFKTFPEPMPETRPVEPMEQPASD